MLQLVIIILYINITKYEKKSLKSLLISFYFHPELQMFDIGTFVSLIIGIELSRKLIKRHQKNTTFKSTISTQGYKVYFPKKHFLFQGKPRKNKPSMRD